MDTRERLTLTQPEITALKRWRDALIAALKTALRLSHAPEHYKISSAGDHGYHLVVELVHKPEDALLQKFISSFCGEMGVNPPEATVGQKTRLDFDFVSQVKAAASREQEHHEDQVELSGIPTEGYTTARANDRRPLAQKRETSRPQSSVVFRKEPAPQFSPREVTNALPSKLVKKTAHLKKTVERPVAPKQVATLTPKDSGETGYETLLKGIRETLGGIPGLRLDQGQNLRKFEGANHVAAIKIVDSYKRNEALYELEKSGYFLSLCGSDIICSKRLESIEMMPAHHRVKTPITNCRNWFQSLGKWIADNNLPYTVLTHPLSIVFANYGMQAEVKVEGSPCQLAHCLKMNNITPENGDGVVRFRLSNGVVATPFMSVAIVPEEEAYAAPKFGVVHNASGGIGHVSSDYGLFDFFEFNRKPSPRHVDYIGKLIDQVGNISIITVIETDCIDNVMRLWIADGQHRFKALEKRGLPIEYCVIRVNSKEEIVRIIAMLNNSGRRWQTSDYLDAWVSLDMPLYKDIATWNEKKFGFSLILEALSGLEAGVAMELFKSGRFTPAESVYKEGLKLLERMDVLKPNVVPLMKVQRGLLKFLKDQKTYDQERMVRALKRSKGSLEFNSLDSLVRIAEKFQAVYAAAA